MRATGIVRRLDDMGRVAVPKETRDLLRWKPGAPVEILSDEGGVYLRAYKPGCMAEGCDETSGLVTAAGLRLCRRHLKEIGEAGKR